MKENGAYIYKEPNFSSPVIGKYPEGIEVTTYFQGNPNFYLIYFDAPVNGNSFGWIHTKEVTLRENEAKRSISSIEPVQPQITQTPAPPPRFNKSGWLYVGLSAQSMSPSDVQTTLGGRAKSLLAYGQQIDAGLYLSSKIGLGIRFKTLNFSSGVDTDGESSLSFYSNGYSTLFTIQYPVYYSGKISLLPGIGAGFSIVTVGSSSNFYKLENSDSIGIPAFTQLRTSYHFTDLFSANIDLGYEIHTLSRISILYPPNGADQSPADRKFNFSGFYCTFSMGINF